MVSSLVDEIKVKFLSDSPNQYLFATVRRGVLMFSHSYSNSRTLHIKIIRWVP